MICSYAPFTELSWRRNPTLHNIPPGVPFKFRRSGLKYGCTSPNNEEVYTIEDGRLRRMEFDSSAVYSGCSLEKARAHNMEIYLV